MERLLNHKIELSKNRSTLRSWYFLLGPVFLWRTLFSGSHLLVTSRLPPTAQMPILQCGHLATKVLSLLMAPTKALVLSLSFHLFISIWTYHLVNRMVCADWPKGSHMSREGGIKHNLTIWFVSCGWILFPRQIKMLLWKGERTALQAKTSYSLQRPSRYSLPWLYANRASFLVHLWKFWSRLMMEFLYLCRK